jgi:hypothetical protein
MGLKYLLSTAEVKQLHVQFGCCVSTYMDCVWFSMDAFIHCVGTCQEGKVYWDRSIHNLEKCASLTKQFLDIVGVVAMVDGNKLISFEPSNHILQNRDYNGWTKDVNRNLVLVWDPFGKIIDAAVNLPGCYHDSRSSLWCKIYDHVAKLPDGYKCVCDDAFCTVGKVKDKLVKTNEQYNEDTVSSKYDQQLTHLRQCSEWGNHVLTGTFRVLLKKLPTDNVRRAKIQWSCIFLHNWRTETVGRNQIQTYFENIRMESND